MCINTGYATIEETYEGKRHEMVRMVQEDFYEVNCFV